MKIISREIKPLAAFSPPPPPIYISALQGCSQWSPGAVCSCLRHLHSFLLYQSKKYIYEGGGV